MLEVRDVRVFYGKHAALQGVSLEVRRGETVVILGANGAGKTTLLNTVSGLIRAEAGSHIAFGGQSIHDRPAPQIVEAGISLVPEGRRIFGDLTVMENMMIPLFARRDGVFRLHAIESVESERELRERAEAMLADVNMLEKRNMHSASMSRGDKRRLEMAMCLVQEPRLLLLDEPTAGMARADTNNTIDLLREIKAKRDITMAIIEHDMHVVFSLADRITVLAQGTPLVEDTPENIKGHPKVQEAYLGEHA